VEAESEEQRLYRVYRVLEDEYVHQHGALPDEYVAAKTTIDNEIRAKLKTEIERESRTDRVREREAERRATPDREATQEETARDERYMRAVEANEKSFDARWAEKYPRYVELLNESFTAELCKHIHDLKEKRTALCFSGGGIRSASSGLGIVQGLARYGLLDKFDYLSTVSGGGYLGGWLSAWIHRARLPAVINALRNEPEKRKLQPEPEPIRHLRSYSNYLNPQLGFLSADTWTLVAIVLRNLLLNWLVLIPIIAAALLLPRIVVVVVQMKSPAGLLVEWAILLGTVFGLIAIVYMGVARPSANRLRKLHDHRLSRQGWFLILCLLALSLSAICLTSWWAWRHNAGHAPYGSPWPWFVLYGVGLHLTAFVIYTLILVAKDFKFWRQRFDWTHQALELLAVILIECFWGLLIWWAAHKVFPTPVSNTSNPIPVTELYACFAAPMFVGIFLLGVILFVGLTSNVTDDEDREWWARFGAWALIVTVLWSGLSALVIFGPVGLMYLGDKTKVILAALGGVSGFFTIFGGMSGKSNAQQEQGGSSGGLMHYALLLAVPVFALTLLIIFSLGTSWLIEYLAPSVGEHGANQLRFDRGGLLNIVHYAPLSVLLGLTLAKDKASENEVSSFCRIVDGRSGQ
jgi:hypothetical protein